MEVKQIQWEDVTDIIQLKGVSPELTEREWNVLNTEIEYKESKRKHASVLRYIKKHIFLNGGCWSKSLLNILKMYNRYHQKFSLANLKKIVNRLKDLGLIGIVNIKKKNVYTLPVAIKVAEKVAEKVANNNSTENIDTTGLQENFEKPKYKIKDNNYNILNTNRENDTDLISRLKKVYRGVKPSLVASKKQLRDIAQSVLVAKGMHSNSYFDKAVQYLVYKKIKYSNQKINLLGAVSYIEKIVDDRLDAYNNKLVEVPNYITGEQNLAFNDFNQREYDWDKLEEELLGWN